MSDLMGEALEKKQAKRCLQSVLLMGLSFSQTPLGATDSIRWGAQGGLLVPASSDLRLTTGSGLNASLGARVEWHSQEWGSREQQTVRFRIDMERYKEGKQVSDAAGLHQDITTKVRNASLGVEQLFYVDDWSYGAGLYAIRWTVDSTNLLATSGGSFTPSGSSNWTRFGLSVALGHRWTEHVEVELRMVGSHYGQENQPIGVVSLNFVWTF
jgi:hypothetical protein